MIAIYPELLQLAEDKEIETLAIRVRKYFCTEAEATKPQLDLLHLSHNLGIALRSSNHGYFATILCVDKLGQFNVSGLINESFAPTDHRFLLAHLMGHLFLHIVPRIAKSEIDGSLGYQESSCPLKMAYSGVLPETTEKEASDFALALLLPKGMFKHAAGSLPTQRAMANFFAVHEHVIKLRSDQLENSQRVLPSNFLAAEKMVQEQKAAQKKRSENSEQIRPAPIPHSPSIEKNGSIVLPSSPQNQRKGHFKTKNTSLSSQNLRATSTDMHSSESPKKAEPSKLKQKETQSPLQASVAHLKGMEKIRTLAKIIERRKHTKSE